MTTENLAQISEADLTNRFKKIDRRIRKLNAELRVEPSTPQAVAEHDRIGTEIDALKVERRAIAADMLRRDKAREARRRKSLDQRQEAGAEAAAELLERLPKFAHQTKTAFEILGDEYAELLELSATVRQANMAMLNARRSACVPCASAIEPNAMHKLAKQQFRECFGDLATNVFLPPAHGRLFDIVAAVDDIVDRCGGVQQESDPVDDEATSSPTSPA